MRIPRHNIPSLNLDSLVDIVSNNVGILVILAVFMAIFAFLQPPETTSNANQDLTAQTEKILIPWAHYSQKASFLFLLRNNRFYYLDRTLVYQHFKQQLSRKDSPDSHMEFENYTVDLIAQSSYSYCLEFQPKPHVGEWWHQLVQTDGLFTKMLAENSPNEFYFYFWVDADSFELFREVRQYLWDQHFEVGWKPVTIHSPLLYCSGAYRQLSFQPQ